MFVSILKVLHLFRWNVKSAIIDLLLNFSWGLSVNGAANGVASSEDFLDGTPELSGDRLLTHLTGNVINDRHGEVSVVLDVLNLLAVTWRLLQGLDQQGSGVWLDLALG